VFIKYCTGDLHSGQVTQPDDSTWGLYFSGHLVVQEVLKFLSSSAFDGVPLANASVVVFSGDIAGGIGTFINLDFVADSLPNAQVLGAPIAGYYFLSFAYTGPNHTSVDVPFDLASWPIYYKLWNSFVPVRCAKANPAEPWYCALGNVSIFTLNTPVFVMEAQTDKVAMGLHDGVSGQPPFSGQLLEYVTQWASNMSIALEPVEAGPADGVFNPACWMHTEFSTTQPIVDGYSYMDAFNNWAFFHSQSIPRIIKDSCGITCNPTCPS